MDFLFILNSALLGVGLAMDAFSVSLANGLNEPKMQQGRIFSIAAIFAAFQGAMPLIGWVLVHTLVEKFSKIEVFIPYIALLLLGYIGTKMLIDGIKEMHCEHCIEGEESCGCKKPLTISMILVQGVATSIDALSVGFTISGYDIWHALISVLIISAVTFAICTAGVFIGKRFGTALAGKSSVFGGTILIIIGLEIFITSFF